MFKYVLKRIGVGILTLFILATVTFFFDEDYTRFAICR